MGWRAVGTEEGMEGPERQKLWDRLVVSGVTFLGSVIVVAVVIFVVVDKMHQKPRTALVLLPNPFDDHLIRFRPEDNDTYAYYVAHLSEYIHRYNSSQLQDPLAVNCTAGRCPTGKKVCLFDIERLGHHCSHQRKFGFEEGKPCVLIFLKPPDDWDPVNFNRSAVPSPLEDRWSPLHLGLHCEGRTDEDNRVMGKLEYWPPEGFPMAYFPYPKKPNFRPPLVMLRFLNPSPDVLIGVRCQLHAVNISPTRNQLYSNEFDIFLEKETPTTPRTLDNSTLDYDSRLISNSSSVSLQHSDNETNEYDTYITSSGVNSQHNTSSYSLVPDTERINSTLNTTMH